MIGGDVEPPSPPCSPCACSARPQVMLDARPIALGSRKALALLAVLALDGSAARARAWRPCCGPTMTTPARGATCGARSFACATPACRSTTATRSRSRDAARPSNRRATTLASPGRGEAASCSTVSITSPATPFPTGSSTWRARLAQRGRQRRRRAAAALHEQRGDWRAALTLHLRASRCRPHQRVGRAACPAHCTRRLGERDAALALFARLESQLHQQLGLSHRCRDARAACSSSRSARTADAGAGAQTRRRRLQPRARAPRCRRARRFPAAQPNATGRTPPGMPDAPCFSPGRRASASRASRPSARRRRRGPVRQLPARRRHSSPYSSAVRALRALLDAAPDLELPPWVDART